MNLIGGFLLTGSRGKAGSRLAISVLELLLNTFVGVGLMHSFFKSFPIVRSDAFF